MDKDNILTEHHESQSQWWARNYMEHNDGKVGETDLAIAFKAGRRAGRIYLWHWCSQEKPKVVTNKRVAVVVMLNRLDYEIVTVLTSEFDEFVQNNAAVLWAYADKLLEGSIQNADFL